MFSIAGKIAAPIRSRIKTETLEILLCVSKNFKVPGRLASTSACWEEFVDSIAIVEEESTEDDE